jgi:hypothetical protein
MEVKIFNELAISTMWMETDGMVKKSSPCDLRPAALWRQAQGSAASHWLRGLLLTLIHFADAASHLKAEPPLKEHIVIIDNTEPRRDVDGKVIDAHGGTGVVLEMIWRERAGRDNCITGGMGKSRAWKERGL